MNAITSPFAAAATYLAGSPSRPATEPADAPTQPATASAARPANRGRSDLPRRLCDTLTACGQLNVAQISEALGIEYRAASKLANNLHARRKVQRVLVGSPESGGSVFAPLGTPPNAAPPAPKSGIKRWLAKKGEPSSEGRAPRKAKPAAATSAVAVSPPPHLWRILPPRCAMRSSTTDRCGSRPARRPSPCRPRRRASCSHTCSACPAC